MVASLRCLHARASHCWLRVRAEPPRSCPTPHPTSESTPSLTPLTPPSSMRRLRPPSILASTRCHRAAARRTSSARRSRSDRCVTWSPGCAWRASRRRWTPVRPAAIATPVDAAFPDVVTTASAWVAARRSAATSYCTRVSVASQTSTAPSAPSAARAPAYPDARRGEGVRWENRAV